MAIEVEGPDGSVVEFPDGTANEVIKGAMAKHYGSPTPQPQPTPQQQTEAMPWYTKAAKALAYGAAAVRTKNADTLRKTEALGFDPDSMDRNTQWLKKQTGTENYDPASSHFSDSSKPWTERIGYLPRALLEGTPEMAQHIAASTVAGPLGMLGSTALSRGGEAVNAVRQADNTDPNVELTPSQKLRVGGDVAIQSILNEIGGRATLGATKPVTGVGMQAVKQAGTNVAKAAATDAAVGAYGAGVDKALLEGKEPTVADLALPGLAGAAVGTAFRSPGAARDAAVATRFRSLGDLDPQSRGEVADTLGHYKGSFEATQKHFVDDLAEAKKGLDADTHDILSKAKIEYDNGQRIDPAKIEAASKADPEAGRVLRNLDTLGVMQSLDNGGLSGSTLGRLLNPYQTGSGKDIPSALGKFAEGASLGHLFWAKDPVTAGTVFGTQIAGTAALKGIDAFTGASNPAKVITDKFGGTAEPAQTVAQAKAAARADFEAKRLQERQDALSKAKAESEAAKSDAQKLKDAQAQAKAEQKAKEAEDKAKQKALDEQLRNERYKLSVMRNSQEPVASDATEALRTARGVERLKQEAATSLQRENDAKLEAVRRQLDLMNNSNKVEQARQSELLKAQGDRLAMMQRSEEASATDATLNLRVARMLKQAEAQREAEAAQADKAQARQDKVDAKAAEKQAQAEAKAKIVEAQAARKAQIVDTGVSQNVPLPELVSSDARMAIKVAKLKQQNANKLAQEQAKAEKKQKSEESIRVQAKAAKRVKEAEEKVKEAKVDADPELLVFEHRGQKIRVSKDQIDNPKAYQEKFVKFTNKRMDLLDKAKGMTKNKSAQNLLDQLAEDWTDSRNDPDQAYQHMMRISGKEEIPENIRQYLKDNWYRVEGTWATKSKNEK